MSKSMLILLRGTVLLSCLAVMPLLAIPAVGHWYDAWLLGELPTGPVAGYGKLLDTKENATDAVEMVAHTVASPPAQPQPDKTAPGLVESGAEARQMSERFEAIPKRLQALGADYLRLESVDAQGSQFRFHCRMPLGESAAYSRPFEVTAADPVEAMEGVLAEVEDWQAARERATETRSARRP